MRGRDTCKAVLGSSLGELPDENGPWGWEDWRGSTGTDKGKLGPRKHEADNSVPMSLKDDTKGWSYLGTCRGLCIVVHVHVNHTLPSTGCSLERQPDRMKEKRGWGLVDSVLQGPCPMTFHSRRQHKGTESQDLGLGLGF